MPNLTPEERMMAEASPAARAAFVPPEHTQLTAEQAYSMTMYAGWRGVIAAFVAHRLDAKPADLVPQTVAWTVLGVALTAYEQWLADQAVSLPDALGAAFDVVRGGLATL